MKAESNQIQESLDQAYAQFSTSPGGANASYIPFLASVPSHLCAAAVVTVDGGLYMAGDATYRFAIESISKVCTLALVMDETSPKVVRTKVGAEPTGLPFNSVMALELHGGKPLSPLVNAGAIATASLVSGPSVETRWEKMLNMQAKLTGVAIKLCEELNRSEQSTNFHNRAIAWLLYSAGYCYCDPMEAVDTYTRGCSTLLSVTELATMGATLAAGGVNPVSHERVVPAANVPHILAEMTMEGLYTSSGDWAYTVGLPGKSGVGGGILAVAPGKLAIAGFSPPLDAAGNSVRGQLMVQQIANDLELNLYASVTA